MSVKFQSQVISSRSLSVDWWSLSVILLTGWGFLSASGRRWFWWISLIWSFSTLFSAFKSCCLSCIERFQSDSILMVLFNFLLRDGTSLHSWQHQLLHFAVLLVNSTQFRWYTFWQIKQLHVKSPVFVVPVSLPQGVGRVWSKGSALPSGRYSDNKGGSLGVVTQTGCLGLGLGWSSLFSFESALLEVSATVHLPDYVFIADAFPFLDDLTILRVDTLAVSFFFNLVSFFEMAVTSDRLFSSQQSQSIKLHCRILTFALFTPQSKQFNSRPIIRTRFDRQEMSGPSVWWLLWIVFITPFVTLK